ncbi:hypothetical protein CHISP_3659 [Chitinispirillum alkaliphilum]|nr:hypothetical protein CHISP_3659 [Chitinispirillum alkaliphilum]
MISLSKNPPIRFPDRLIEEAPHPWWVAKVKPRQEKALAFDLIELNVEYFLPMYTNVTRRPDNNKPRKSFLCLFPGYICFSANRGEVSGLYKTSRIVKLLEVKNQNRFRKEISQIYLALENKLSIAPANNPMDYKEGEAVEVVRGPMRGMQGKFLKMASCARLVLSVEMLGSASVLIDASDVKPLTSSGAVS